MDIEQLREAAESLIELGDDAIALPSFWAENGRGFLELIDKHDAAMSAIEKLDSALIIFAPAYNQRMKRGEMCWCAVDYDVDKYNHSIACEAAKEALQAADAATEKK